MLELSSIYRRHSKIALNTKTMKPIKISKKENIRTPSVTIAMISYNDEKIIEECFRSIKKQNYGGKVSILIVDGGSTDKTIKIAKKYGAKIIIMSQYKDQPYKRGDIALNSATTDIVIFFSADNRFKENNCLTKIIMPFLDKEISAVETFRYGYNQENSLLTKYFALIGGTDPIAVSLGKADRAPHDASKWHSFGSVEENVNYYKVTFDNDVNKIPTLGANGFAIRNNLIKKFPLKDSLHVEMCVRLIAGGFNKFAFVKNVHIIHDTQSNLTELLRRKLQWKNLYSNTTLKRSYFVYNPRKDLLRLVSIIFLSLTLIVPILRSIKGFFKKKEIAWFLHPIIGLIFIINYGLSTIISILTERPASFKNE